MSTKRSSQLSKFYKRTIEERRDLITGWNDVCDAGLFDSDLSLMQADHMIENVVSTYALPFGIATNFLINDRDYLIPMVIEEPSVVAAASNAAGMFRSGGGFHTSSDEPMMIGQIQILDLLDLNKAAQAITDARESLLIRANEAAGSIVRRGGGLEISKFGCFLRPVLAPCLWCTC